eukprot:scaffold22438_cov21-Tisochrysis_lutea.AAC.4
MTAPPCGLSSGIWPRCAEKLFMDQADKHAHKALGTHALCGLSSGMRSRCAEKLLMNQADQAGKQTYKALGTLVFVYIVPVPHSSRVLTTLFKQFPAMPCLHLG